VADDADSALSGVLKLLRLALRLSRDQPLFLTLLKKMAAKYPRFYKLELADLTIKMQLKTSGHTRHWELARGCKFPSKIAAQINKAMAAAKKTRPKEKYILLPVTYDYNTPMLHQGALLIQPAARKLVIYEPYGTYAKYGASYMAPLTEYCGALECDIITTWHTELHGPGLQTCMIRGNNKLVNAFRKAEAAFIKDMPPALVKNLAPSDTRDIDESNPDLTASAIDIAAIAVASKKERVMIVGLLLFIFSSKLCVSITLVELEFFAKNKLDQLYIDVASRKYPTCGLIEHLADYI
jgi:hypothetical protein